VVRVYPGSTPNRMSRITRSGTSCGRRSTRPRPKRSGTRPSAYWNREIGRVHRAGLDRAGHPAGSCEAVVADLDRRHADLARLAGLREWQGQTYPSAGWPAIIDVDTHERLVRVLSQRRCPSAGGD
jgi:hypothetical protein